MASKGLYLIILILAVVIVADMIFMFQGLLPIQPSPAPPPEDGGEKEREPITSANIGKNLELLQGDLQEATKILNDISASLD